MTTMTNPNKRQRTTAPLNAPHSLLHMSEVPDEAMAVVASFLAKPSRALFAAAMTAPSSSWRDSERKGTLSPACQAILSLNTSPHCPTGRCRRRHETTMWATLDFADVERSLAARLSDDDIRAALLCVRAPPDLEILKLTGCVNVTGRGLDPLRGSAVLRQIDLGLVGKHESPIIVPEPRMSEAEVLPILDSIIDASGSSIKQVQLPKKFRSIEKGGEPGELIENFVFKYGQFMERLGGTCSKCECEDDEEACWGSENINGISWFIDDEGSQLYGCQNFTCYECTGHFCERSCVAHCAECEKAFCNDCDQILQCTACHVEKCAACWERKPCDCRA